MTPSKYYMDITRKLLEVPPDASMRIDVLTINDEGRLLRENGIKMEGLSLVACH